MPIVDDDQYLTNLNFISDRVGCGTFKMWFPSSGAYYITERKPVEGGNGTTEALLKELVNGLNQDDWCIIWGVMSKWLLKDSSEFQHILWMIETFLLGGGGGVFGRIISGFF